MKYLIVQDWGTTHGNHAGMVHMSKLLSQKYPDEYKVIIKDCPLNFPVKERKQVFIKRFLTHRLIRKVYEKYIYPLEYKELCKPMFRELKDGDEVLLLEYLLSGQSQYELAMYIKSNFPNVRLYALSHQTVSYFKTNDSANEIMKWANPIDKMLTLGSSLSNFFEEIGIPKAKICTGFHYVDSDYYHKGNTEFAALNNPITIIAMGSQQRDYPLLAKVVSETLSVHWIICRGNNLVDDLFPHSKNIELKGFLSEDELRHQMDRADVSINIMSDTVGSNVITTSMAMGLAMIVSDVGSIRDYCNEDNAIFCSNEADSFIKAINELKDSQERVLVMRKNSLKTSKRLHIENVHKWFNSLSE